MRPYDGDRKVAVVVVGTDLTGTSITVDAAAVAAFPDGERTFENPDTGETIIATAGFGTAVWTISRGANQTAAHQAPILATTVLEEIAGANDYAEFVQRSEAGTTFVTPAGATPDATTTTVGVGLANTNPSGAHPKFLTTDDTGLPTGDLSTTTPAADGVAAVGTSAKAARADHVHPSAGGGPGTVTSVGLSLPGDFTVSNSPVTGAGTLTAVRNTQSANTVFAGPTTGSPASPTYRLLVGTDLPAATTTTQGAVTLSNVTPSSDGTGAIGSSTAAARADHVHPLVTSFTAEVTVPDLKVTGLTGSVQAMRMVGATASGAPLSGSHLVGDVSLSLADGKYYVCTVAGTPGTFVSAPGSGTVTSVGLTVPSALLNVSGSPITSSGTLAVSLATQSANTVLAGPTTGSAATPTMRALVAADLPTISWATKTANYTITTADSGIAVDATSGNITLTLPTAVGSTQAYAIKRIDASANIVTIATASGQTIDGFSTIPLIVQDQAVVVASTNVNWLIEASFYPNPDTTRGDLTVTNAAGALARLGVGASGTFLAGGTDPTYRAIAASDLPVATTAALGAVKPDGTSVTVSGGIISTPGTGGATRLAMQSGSVAPPVPLWSSAGDDYVYLSIGTP